MTNITETITELFSGKRIVIVGDLVADQFLSGTISRVSREAPVFILRHDETETRAGGAANAAVNIASLGGAAILVGLVGDDGDGSNLLEKLAAADVDCRFVIKSPGVRTTTKVRVLAGQHYAPRQQVIRIDYENKNGIADELGEQLKVNLRAAAGDAAAILFSDYGYGVAGAEIFALARLIADERRIPLLIDSRFRLGDFCGATTATPNQEEVEQILGEDFTTETCAALRVRLGLEALLVTCGNKGMLLLEDGKKPLRIAAVGSTQPVDVTGAGDTVIAVYALALACRMSFADSAKLANHAGGIVVMKKGTAAVTVEELLASMTANDGKYAADEAADTNLIQ